MLTTMPAVNRAAELASELRVAVVRLSRRLRHERPDTALSLSQLATLGTLDRHGHLTPRELADHEGVQPPSMTRLLAALEARHLVSRSAHPTDGRQVLVGLTGDARVLLREDRRRREAWLAQRLADLDADEIDVLRRAVDLLDRLATS
jgi:DNA-binding MarR family transcriptional regulator